MRIWSLHPRLLDGKGLVACWRETLLAQKVLAGETTGYRNHPQLQRFRATPDPMAAIGAYLCGVEAEALNRGYAFNAGLIRVRPELVEGCVPGTLAPPLPVTTGQLSYEFEHLMAKVAIRDPAHALALTGRPGLQRAGTGPDPVTTPATAWLPSQAYVPEPHPLFSVDEGPMADWERTVK
ncbi:pyrimidine dimer DNA glycosylase/endonuclease V [Arthrobacter sp.]|uniref:pyrimidine dimer DNA glycosylase/endonuclease V n=1 Tax=Arthrobacter sp. TaxID=1667 RepID=UPI0033921C88